MPSPLDIEAARSAAVRAAREGGRIARQRLGNPGYIRWKGHRDPVCEAMFSVQDAVSAVLKTEFPDSSILAEEGPEDAELPVDAEQLWIVDPVCGSLNYVHGIPHFAICIALRAEGNLRLGVVYDPCRDELFEARDTGPARLNGVQIVVRHFSEGIEAWSNAMVGTDWPSRGEARAKARRITDLMLDQVGECIMMGSPALGFCNVAAGRLHAYWHLDLKIWDVAAASLILQRAGAVLTDAHGDTWLYSDGGYIATNSLIHGWVLNCLRPIL